MKIWSAPLASSNDPLNRYRDLLFYWMSIAVMIFLTPFVIYTFYKGLLLLGLCGLLIVVFIAIDATFMHLGKAPLIPPIMVFIPTVGSLSLAVVQYGVIGVLWTFPAIIMFQLVLPRVQAKILGVVAIALVSALAFEHLPTSIALRSAVTLTLTFFFATLSEAIILDLYKRLQDNTVLDSLTGLFNRRHLENSLDAQLAQHARHGTPCSLLLMHIDFTIERYAGRGTEIRDRTLVRIVDLWRPMMRPTDVLFRIGDQEFAALLPATALDVAAQVSERVRAEITRATVLPIRPIVVSTVFEELEPGDEPGTFLRRCQGALERIKDTNRQKAETASQPAIGAEGPNQSPASF